MTGFGCLTNSEQRRAKQGAAPFDHSCQSLNLLLIVAVSLQLVLVFICALIRNGCGVKRGFMVQVSDVFTISALFLCVSLYSAWCCDVCVQEVCWWKGGLWRWEGGQCDSFKKPHIDTLISHTVYYKSDKHLSVHTEK